MDDTAVKSTWKLPFFLAEGGEKNISSTIICANCCFVWCVVFFLMC